MPEAIMLATEVDRHSQATGHSRYAMEYDPKVDKPTDPVRMRCLQCSDRRRRTRGPG